MQNSIVIKKPKDRQGFQIIKKERELQINFFNSSTSPILTPNGYGTVTIAGALALGKFTDFPDNPVNGMLIMLETTPPGPAGIPVQELWCYLNASWAKVNLK